MKHAKIPKRIQNVNDLLHYMETKAAGKMKPLDMTLYPIAKALYENSGNIDEYIFAWKDKEGVCHAVTTKNIKELIKIVEDARMILYRILIEE